eukprot:scaffold159078_cov15-Tisochrysis_lutea.AAC.1
MPTDSSPSSGPGEFGKYVQGNIHTHGPESTDSLLKHQKFTRKMASDVEQPYSFCPLPALAQKNQTKPETEG